MSKWEYVSPRSHVWNSWCAFWCRYLPCVLAVKSIVRSLSPSLCKTLLKSIFQHCKPQFASRGLTVCTEHSALSFEGLNIMQKTKRKMKFCDWNTSHNFSSFAIHFHIKNDVIFLWSVANKHVPNMICRPEHLCYDGMLWHILLLLKNCSFSEFGYGAWLYCNFDNIFFYCSALVHILWIRDKENPLTGKKKVVR